MSLRETCYRLTVRALRAVSPLAARGDSKLARGIRGRRDAAATLVERAREERDPDRPLAWIHAPSVGEGFQALAVVEALLELRADVQVVYTYFSPSAGPFAGRMPAIHAGFLPWDLPDETGPVLEALRPDLLAFTKTEVWPVLSAEAARRGVPLFLVGGSLPAGAGRLSAPGRWILRPAFRRLRSVAAISAEDAGRFPILGVSPDRIVVTGDPGVDSAAQRLAETDPDASHLRPFRQDPRPTLIAGSTWPPDEERLVPAASRVRRVEPDLRIVVAPHEPTADHVESLVDALDGAGWRVALLAEVEERGSAAEADAVVVDRVGVLAELYTVGTLAYVGGGFHGEGLHSVLEPAAAGLPVLFGPEHGTARAARELRECAGGVAAESQDELAAALAGWLRHPETARRAGRRAREYVEGHRGAARRTAELLAGAVDRTPDEAEARPPDGQPSRERGPPEDRTP